MTTQYPLEAKIFEIVLLEQMLIVVWLFILFYSVVYFYINAILAASCLCVGVLVLTPLIKLLKKKRV